MFYLALLPVVLSKNNKLTISNYQLVNNAQWNVPACRLSSFKLHNFLPLIPCTLPECWSFSVRLQGFIWNTQWGNETPSKKMTAILPIACLHHALSTIISYNYADRIEANQLTGNKFPTRRGFVHMESHEKLKVRNKYGSSNTRTPEDVNILCVEMSQDLSTMVHMVDGCIGFVKCNSV